MDEANSDGAIVVVTDILFDTNESSKVFLIVFIFGNNTKRSKLEQKYAYLADYSENRNSTMYTFVTHNTLEYRLLSVLHQVISSSCFFQIIFAVISVYWNYLSQ